MKRGERPLPDSSAFRDSCSLRRSGWRSYAVTQSNEACQWRQSAALRSRDRPHPYLQLEEWERAVLVTSGGERPTVWGCWSMATEDAEGLMTDIFELAHGGPLP